MRGMTGMAGGSAPLEIALPGDMARMLGKALVTHDAGAFVTAVAERVGKGVFNDVIAGVKIVNQQSLIFGTMGATGRVWIFAAVTVGAFDHRNIICFDFLFTIGAYQTDYRQVFTLPLYRMKRGIVDGELESLVGGFHRQIGAFGMAQVAEFIFLGDRSVEIAGLFPFQAGVGVIAGNIVGAVAIGTLGMSRHGLFPLGQRLTCAVNVAFILVEGRVVVILGKFLADIPGLYRSELKRAPYGICRTVTGKTLIRAAAVAEIETDMTGGATYGQVFPIKMGWLRRSSIRRSA